MPRTRILCLHGDGTNGTIFAAQTRHLRRALNPHGIELVYATGPYECSAGYGVSPFFDDCGPFYRWYAAEQCPEDSDDDCANASDTSTAGVMETFEELKYEFGDQEDPETGQDGQDTFAGILAFSSAAGIAAGVLASQRDAASDVGSPVWYRFRFGVIINGTGRPMQFNNTAQCGKMSIKTPTVFVIGTRDQWQGQSRSLVDYFDHKAQTCLEFENDHRVPSDPQQVEDVVNAICKVAHQSRRL
ncbi:serine hydrolase FSH [Colletotrichum cereale]|nr:serine hydrolase FSH [Colletotrichum cereale]